MAERVLLAMSGGVDSSVAAVMLREAGHEVIGLFMNFFASPTRRRPGSRSCCAVEDAGDARRVAAALSIPFYSVDMAKQFEAVRENFISEYRQGRTPIPCTLCNRDVKFGSLLDYADSIGADRVATGHYAVRREDESGNVTLHRACHPEKDQTYFLWPLSPEGLRRSMFPVGELSKSEVREVAVRHGLLTADKPESQDLCFVPDGDHMAYLREQEGVTTRPGDIVDGSGAVVGRHDGTMGITIGQRRGLGVAVGEPRYVVALRPESDQVVVGARHELAAGGLIASGASWPGGEAPAAPVRAEVKIRHTRHGHAATVTPLPDGGLEVRFDEPVEGVAPGQAAVCYDGTRVLCGAWIDRAISAPPTR